MDALPSVWRCLPDLLVIYVVVVGPFAILIGRLLADADKDD